MPPKRAMGSSSVDVRRGPERFRTRIDWLDSWHSFSFGPHYDPDNVRHGLLVVSNDDVIKAGAGFPTHPHQDMEIVTWVLSGRLEHEDSTGQKGVLYPGLAQRMSAGSGIRHSEKNPDPRTDLHLVQMWVLPDARGIAPGYEQRDMTPVLERGGLVAVASGRGHAGAVTLHQKDAVLWVGRLRPGGTVKVPDAPFAHVYVAKGRARLEEAGDLSEGDAVRLTGAGERGLTAGPSGAEVLVWEMHAG